MSAISELDALLVAASRAGADAADAFMVEGRNLAVQQRLGRTEEVIRSESVEIGLRVMVGLRSAIVSTNQINRVGLDTLAERAIAMARSVPEDKFSGLAEFPCSTPFADLDLDDAEEPGPEVLVARAAEAEDAARAIPGVTNSEGASASWSRTAFTLAATNGFAGGYSRTSSSIAATVLAGTSTTMERDYEYSVAVHHADVENPGLVGRRAGERAVRRLNPRRLASGRMPVIFDPRVSGSLVSHFASCINGASVARNTSILKNRMGDRIFPAGIYIHDDPLRPRGLRSRPFDGEGVAGQPRSLIEDGVLKTWLLDCRTGRQLGLATTGHAGRSPSSPPSPGPTNLWMAEGAVTPAALLGGVGNGLYVTELIGSGFNQVTGDYSRGAVGFLIRNGRIEEPVSGITIAGNIMSIFEKITPADDLEFKSSVNAPTVLIEEMTIAGL
jgi:PmbA protein